MKPVTQTLFGRPDGPVEEIGNCYPACLATLLELDLAEVPHVYQLHADPEAANDASVRWLQQRGYTELYFEWAPWLNHYAPGTLAIFGGKSPRGDWSHAVVGEITATGWRLVHDPHPSRAGIAGEPDGVHLLVKLMPAPVDAKSPSECIASCGSGEPCDVSRCPLPEPAEVMP